MTFDEAEIACQRIAELGEKLLEYPVADVAKSLEKKCQYYSPLMRGRFGNVAEQFGWAVGRVPPGRKGMGLWIEENLPALLFGAGMGGIVTGWFHPHDFIWVLGSLAGVGLAVPIWQINRDRWMSRDR